MHPKDKEILDLRKKIRDINRRNAVIKISMGMLSALLADYFTTAFLSCPETSNTASA